MTKNESPNDLQNLERLNGPILSRLRQAVALCLWEAGAIKVDAAMPFTLASGLRSPIYVNCRQVLADPDFLRLFVAVAANILARRRAVFDAVAGGETAGIPFAYALGTALAKPTVYVRKKAKDYGLANRVEGRIAPGARVLLVEDLITDGGSKATFLEALAEVGAHVTDALVLFDREQGGSEELGRRGVRLHSVTNRSIAFQVGQSAGLLDETALRSVEEYFGDPVRWAERRGF